MAPIKRNPRTTVPVAIAVALLLTAVPGVAAPPDGSPGHADPPPDTRCDEVTCGLLLLDDDLNAYNVLDTAPAPGPAGDLYWGDARLWSAAVDGPGSGLDADLLDGLDSPQFLRSDVSGTLDGDLSVTGRVGIGGTSPRAMLYLKEHDGKPANMVLDGQGSGQVQFYVNGQQRGFLHVTPLTGDAAGRSNVLVIGVDGRWLPGNPAGIAFSVLQEGHPFDNIEAMRIDESGEVGIGTSSPEGALHIVGAPQDYVDTGNSAVGTNRAYPLKIYRSDSATRHLILGVNSGNPGFSYIQAANPGSTIPDLVLNPESGASDANVGIGTTTPTAKLDVDGTARADAVQIDPSSLGTCDASARGTMRFVAGASGVADQLYLCRKDASDAYGWVAVL